VALARRANVALPERSHGAAVVSFCRIRRSSSSSNVYYATVHFPGADHLPHLVLLSGTVSTTPRCATPSRSLTAACLLMQLIPVAPPRMFANLGFVDTALRYGQSVYGAVGERLRRSALGDAVGARRLGGVDRGVRAPDQPEPVALARAPCTPSLTILIVTVTREPLVARRCHRGHPPSRWRSSTERWSRRADRQNARRRAVNVTSG